MSEGGQKVHTSSYKVNKVWEFNDHSKQYCIVYLKVAEKADLESSHQEKKF